MLARISLISAFSLLVVSCAQPSEKTLEGIHQSIESRYVNVRHITAEQLQARNADSYVIFDVRDRAEFEVSHIANAVHIDPDMSGIAFEQKYGQMVEGRDIIYYCSVGERSSRMAQRVAALSNNPGSIYNLEQGIFGWHNAELSLMSEGKMTPWVHPYDEEWGQYVKRQELTRYAAGD